MVRNAFCRPWALAAAAFIVAGPAHASLQVTADVSLHVQYRGDLGGLPVFRLTNLSTAGESVGAVMLTPPGPDWVIRACPQGPAGWARAVVGGSCVFKSAAGRLDDVAAGAAATFQASVDALPGSTNATGVWDVRVATNENVTADSPIASAGEGGLGAAIRVFEVVDAVVTTAQISPGVACPPPARRATAGATRNIVICGRSHANVALTPQAAASSLGGTFVAASGTFASRLAVAGFSGVLATWDGSTVTNTPGSQLTVRVTIGSSGNATSPQTDLGGYQATPPVPAPTLTKTVPPSPANNNSPRLVGNATAGSTVRVYTNSGCTVGPVATGSARDFELLGFPMPVTDNTSTTFHATATDSFGTVSPCSSGLTYVEDSAAPSFAGLRTATSLSPTAIRLAWHAASDSVSSAPQIVYDVCRSSTPAGCTPFRADISTGPGWLSLDVTGLLSDTRYYFVVRARDLAGNRDANTVERSGRTLGTKSTVRVSAGSGHACALESDGTVWCWGRNDYGQVGRGTVSRTSAPTLVLRGAVDVQASFGLTCAVLADGGVRCWGINDHGQLGDGTTVNKRSPTAVVGITDAIAVSPGPAHACALHAGGTVSCWGWNPVGELGNGTTNDSPLPVPVSDLTGVRAIASGSQHTCALMSNGAVRCWGLNRYGQLGDGTNDNRLEPVLVSVLTGAIALAAGHWHTCALIADGEVDCWGRGNVGQIGDGNTDDHDYPVAVDMPHDAVSIAAGGGEPDGGWSCAVSAEGFARCWGANFEGNFGIGSATNETPSPTTLTAYADMAAVSTGVDFGCFLLAHGSLLCAGRNDLGQLGNTTTASPSLSPVGVNLTLASMGAAVSSGSRHTCTAIADGTVRCWGHNGAGRLGNGTTTASTVPVTVSGLYGARSVSAGGEHTCALAADGTARCWGSNASGQLGNGTIIDQPVPVTVDGLTDVVSVAAGADFTCALDAHGRAWCWGDNSFGQLGVGNWAPRSTVPVAVPDLPRVVAIAAGSRHACAILEDGWAACWGDNASGQIGPQSQFGFAPEGALAIAAGESHTCALLADGTARCWGANASGQLGDGTTMESRQPVVVAGIAGAKAIAVGTDHTCALLADSVVRCWGGNADGQLGNGSTQGSGSPVAVTNLGAAAIEAGSSHTCALKVDGTASCWGAGGDGRLGNGLTSSRTTPVQVTPFP